MLRLMYLSYEGDLEGIQELVDYGVDVNFRDIDGRLHIASCQGFIEVVELLLNYGAEVDPKDRRGSTPLAGAVHYKKHDVFILLEKHGAMPLVPDYGIDPKELDFKNSLQIAKVRPLKRFQHLEALWRRRGSSFSISIRTRSSQSGSTI